MAVDNLKVLKMGRIHQGVSDGIGCLDRIRADIKQMIKDDPFNDGVMAVGVAIKDAMDKLAAANVKLTYNLKDELEDMYTGYCGHRAKRGKALECGCGPAPM